MKKLRIYILALLFCCFISAEAAPKIYNVTSPDGKISVEIQAGEELSYMVRYEGDVIVDKSEIAMTLADGTVVGASSRITSAKKNRVAENISAPLYRQKEFTAEANEIVLKMKGGFNVTFRAYNDGVAYRFSTTLKDQAAPRP